MAVSFYGASVAKIAFPAPTQAGALGFCQTFKDLLVQYLAAFGLPLLFDIGPEAAVLEINVLGRQTSRFTPYRERESSTGGQVYEGRYKYAGVEVEKKHEPIL